MTQSHHDRRTARSLQDLALIRKALADAAAERARRMLEAKRAAEREERERRLFELTVGQVAPLRRDAVTPLARVPPAPLPRQRERDEAAVLREAISDEFDVESLLETDDALSYRRSGIGPEVAHGLRCVRVIHGKGNGSPGREPVLKAKVKTWLVQKNEVLAFAQARAADGGHGALMVLLRPSGPGFDARGATRRTHPAEPERS